MRADIINVATKEIGVAEFPDGSNHSPYGEWFGLQGVPWCAIFCSWVYHNAGHDLGKGDYAKGFASVPFLMQHFKKQITTDPKTGDLIIFDWQKGKVAESDWTADHIGIFVEWIDKKAGTFYTIEGNTSSANQSNGGMVQKRQRNLAFVQCFINPLNL